MNVAPIARFSFVVILTLLIVGCAARSTDVVPSVTPSSSFQFSNTPTAEITDTPSPTGVVQQSNDSCVIGTPLPETNINNALAKSCEANDIVILGFDDVESASLEQVHAVVETLSGFIPDEMEVLAENQVRLVIYRNEAHGTENAPTFEYVKAQLGIAKTPDSERSSGEKYGGYYEPGTDKVVIVWQSDVLCEPRWGHNQYVLHEIAHGLEVNIFRDNADNEWEERLTQAFQTATALPKDENKWIDTNAMSNKSEYWAYGVPVYFNVGWEDGPTGDPGRVVTKAELKSDHLLLYELIGKFFEYEDWTPECP